MTFEEILLLGEKTLICYLFLFVILKIMGKREIGELSMFDIVCYLIIAELFSLSLNSHDNSILYSIIPVTLIVIFQMVTAKLSLRFRKFRKIMEGTPSFLIYRGKINYQAMKKNRYNLDDLLLQLRTKDIQNPLDVEFAMLENNGDLNIISKENNKLIDPLPLILDGEINFTTLKRINMSKEELDTLIKKHNYKNESEVFLLMLERNAPIFISYKELEEENDI